MSETSIDGADLIARARAYVEASNRHDMAAIGPMFADDVIYQSSGVGTHEGAEAIRIMMAAFHEANPDVHWQTERYRMVGDDGVAGSSDRVRFLKVSVVMPDPSSGSAGSRPRSAP